MPARTARHDAFTNTAAAPTTLEIGYARHTCTTAAATVTTTVTTTYS